MPKINIYLPDDLADAVKDAGVPVSAICQRALETAVRRVTALREVAGGATSVAAGDGPVALYFTKRAMAVLESAQRRAGSSPGAPVRTEDLLVALVSSDNMAMRVLRALEITPGQVRAELHRRGAESAAAQAGQPHQEAAAGPVAAEPRMDPLTARAVEIAANESSGLGNNYVGCEHLLLGLISEPDGIAGSVLRSLGADLRVTRRTVAAALAGWGAGFAAHEQRTSDQQADLPTTGPAEKDAGQQANAGRLAEVIRAELAPLLSRIERLEELTGTP
jgi:ATP-dependent Clp protease ATP-binding subunit ClpA/post-segregation antitoxin (ccd killing protein)